MAFVSNRCGTGFVVFQYFVWELTFYRTLKGGDGCFAGLRYDKACKLWIKKRGDHKAPLLPGIQNLIKAVFNH